MERKNGLKKWQGIHRRYKRKANTETGKVSESCEKHTEETIIWTKPVIVNLQCEGRKWMKMLP